MKIRRLFWLPVKAIGVCITLIIFYFLSAVVLSKITVNTDFVEDVKNGYDIYILTNGVHLDIVLPYHDDVQDWSTFVNAADTKSGDTTSQFVSFGWGDKGFYLETKTWDDLKFNTAFNALFYRSTSAMHVTFYKQMRESESCRKIRISKESYYRLVNYVHQSFDIDSMDNPIKIKDAAYHDHDSFYEAQGRYSLFFTCNTWSNHALKTAGLKACLWTPFDKEIVGLYSKD